MSGLALKRIAKNKKTKARSLDLSDCGLTTLPPELGDCVWLEELILGNELPVMKTLLRYISAFLKEEDKANNVLAKGKNNKIVNLDEGLPKLGNLKKLMFWGQPISDLFPLSGEICEAHGIKDELKQSDLSRYFHDIGVFLHFQDHPLLKRDVFLQNQWVTDAVYKILDDTEIAEQKRGRFEKTDRVRLWN